jgi:hypothetical protein
LTGGRFISGSDKESLWKPLESSSTPPAALRNDFELLAKGVDIEESVEIFP